MNKFLKQFGRTNGSLIKKPLVLISTLILPILSLQGAQVNAAEDLKKEREFGVVDMQKIILNVDEGKNARKQLETEIQAKEKDLSKQKQELDELNKNWQQQAAVLSEQARMAKQKEFQEKFMTLRQAEMDFQNQIKQKEQAATQKIAIKVAGIVEKIAKDKNLEAVFETNSSGLLYLKNPIDLTQDIIVAYDSANKESSPKAEPKKSAKK